MGALRNGSDEMTATKPLGPNMRKLAIRRAAILAVPPGTTNPTQAVVDVLVSPKRYAELMRSAVTWAREAVAVYRTAPDRDPGLDTDEEIAGEILRRIEERTNGR